MEYKAEVNYSTGLISAVGSEDFVMRVLDWAKDQRDSFRVEPSSNLNFKPPLGNEGNGSAQSPDEGDALTKFSDVFARRGDDVVVITDTKQNSTAATARYTTLLYLFGRKLIGKVETSDDEIRKVCEEHACYDSKNFASHIDGLKGKIIQDGSSRKFTAKLTAPGERDARATAEKLQNDAAEA